MDQHFDRARPHAPGGAEMDSASRTNPSRPRRKSAYVPDDPLLDARESGAETGPCAFDILARCTRWTAAAPLSRHAEVPPLAALRIAGGGGCLQDVRVRSLMMCVAACWAEPLALLLLATLLGLALI